MILIPLPHDPAGGLRMYKVLSFCYFSLALSNLSYSSGRSQHIGETSISAPNYVWNFFRQRQH